MSLVRALRGRLSRSLGEEMFGQIWEKLPRGKTRQEY